MDSRVKDVRKYLKAVDQTRSRAAEIGGAVDNVNPIIADASQRCPTRIGFQDGQFLLRPLNGEAAASDNQNFRIGDDNLFPVDRLRVCTGKPNHFASAR